MPAAAAAGASTVVVRDRRRGGANRSGIDRPPGRGRYRGSETETRSRDQARGRRRLAHADHWRGPRHEKAGRPAVDGRPISGQTVGRHRRSRPRSPSPPAGREFGQETARLCAPKGGGGPFFRRADRPGPAALSPQFQRGRRKRSRSPNGVTATFAFPPGRQGIGGAPAPTRHGSRMPLAGQQRQDQDRNRRPQPRALRSRRQYASLSGSRPASVAERRGGRARISGTRHRRSLSRMATPRRRGPTRPRRQSCGRGIRRRHRQGA